MAHARHARLVIVEVHTDELVEGGRYVAGWVCAPICFIAPTHRMSSARNRLYFARPSIEFAVSSIQRIK
jgi:hypothetical protein